LNRQNPGNAAEARAPIKPMTPALAGGAFHEFVHVTTLFLSHSSYFDTRLDPKRIGLSRRAGQL
jgi:hypothetical protein